ncbi:MAG: HYR domain-containing protein [Saprospirales bacterium]|nr:HYR domain-containing protein [Saprospirales bacterium]
MGGTYSGPGVNAGMFNPAGGTPRGPYDHVHLHDGNNCTTCTFTITVNPLPVVTCPTNSTVCIDAGAFALIGGNPMAGTYSGPGVNAGMFNPSAAGAGAHTITYTYTDGNSCTNSCTFTITVAVQSTVTCPSNATVCINISPYALTGGNPGGGAYSGPGVNEGMFNPAAAGTGVHTITYTYPIGSNCSNWCTFTITVIPCTTISGDIFWEQNEGLGVNQVTVKLTGDQTLTTTTNTSGFYSLNPGSGSNFIVTPTKTINKLNGVTVADVTAIQQHVANINLLPAPFKRIAADVNKSNTISSLDATLISQAPFGQSGGAEPDHFLAIRTLLVYLPQSEYPLGFPGKDHSHRGERRCSKSGFQRDQIGRRGGDVCQPCQLWSWGAAGFACGRPGIANG